MPWHEWLAWGIVAVGAVVIGCVWFLWVLAKGMDG